eukprot:369443_1
MSMDSFFSSLKVRDKIDFYDEEDKTVHHWKVAVIQDIKTYKSEYNIHLSFNRWYGTYHCHIDSDWECEKCNKWISSKALYTDFKILQPLNTHTPYHDPNSKSCSYEFERNFGTYSICCTKCARECCSFCFVVRFSDNSVDSKSIFCKECVQICHKNDKCQDSYADKCTTCQNRCCRKCSFILIYNRSNGKLISCECYQCYPFKQYQLILTITQSMFRKSSTTNTDINILKLITDFVHNTTLKCEYNNCSQHNILRIPRRNLSIVSLLHTIYIDIDRDCAFICNNHVYYWGNVSKLRCTTIQNCHFPDNVTNCGHCQSRKICIECDKIIKCIECGKVCHRFCGDSQGSYQDYMIINNEKQSRKVLLTQCKDCYSSKRYKYQFNITKLICKSMFLQNQTMEFEMNLIELILNYYFEDLWSQFSVLPTTPFQIQNGSWRIDVKSGYPGKVTELKMCKTGKHGHKKFTYKLLIPYTGQILFIMHRQFDMFMTCVMKTDKYIFNGYEDNEKKLVQCKNQKTGEQIKIAISPFDKLIDLIGKKGDDEKLILYVLSGLKCSSEKLEVVQCIVDAKIEQDVYDVMD